MLEYKGLPYRRLDLVNGFHAMILRALGFPEGTVPALDLGAQKIQGTGRIARELDRLKPDPRLFPADPSERERVERAERWGDATLQAAARHLALAAFQRDRSSVGEFLSDAQLVVPVPLRLAVAMSPLMVRIQRRRHRGTDAAARAALAALPGYLDEVDRLIAEGVIGGEPNAADFQIATSVRLLTLFDDLHEYVCSRPAGRHALDIVPDYPGHFRRVFPEDWLEPVRASAPV
jgi:glutathione S-transferase